MKFSINFTVFISKLGTTDRPIKYITGNVGIFEITFYKEQKVKITVQIIKHSTRQNLYYVYNVLYTLLRWILIFLIAVGINDKNS